jgi:NAD(P)-dependent dehydrogenase (short-subunit alcohol dehydrogenase family)
MAFIQFTTTLVAEVEQVQGRIDLFVSNAGYVSFEGLEGDIGALDHMLGGPRKSSCLRGPCRPTGND